MKRFSLFLLGALLVVSGCANSRKGNSDLPKVYMYSEITSENLVKIYEALDRACTDLVRNSNDPGNADLIERIDSRHGMHTLDAAEALGLGSQSYELIILD